MVAVRSTRQVYGPCTVVRWRSWCGATIPRMGATTAGMGCPTALLVIDGGLDFAIGATSGVGAAVSCSLMVHTCSGRRPR